MNQDPNNHSLFIFDARPWLNAEANRASGGGYESVTNYDKVELEFAGNGSLFIDFFTSFFFFSSSFLASFFKN